MFRGARFASPAVAAAILLFAALVSSSITPVNLEVGEYTFNRATEVPSGSYASLGVGDGIAALLTCNPFGEVYLVPVSAIEGVRLTHDGATQSEPTLSDLLNGALPPRATC